MGEQFMLFRIPTMWLAKSRVFLVLMSLGLGFLLVPAPTPVAANAGAGDGTIEACYSAPFSPDQRLPFNVSTDEWCHPLFKNIEVVAEPDGAVTIKWEPASRHVYWYCGPGYAKQDCPINEYRVELTGAPSGAPRCSAGPNETSCTLRGLRPGIYGVGLSAYLANGNWFRYHTSVEACCRVPSPPLAISPIPVRDAVDVSWQQPHWWGGAQELTYVVATDPPAASCTTTDLACRLEGLQYGQPYVVTVQASNAAGSSSVSRAANPVQLQLSVPSAPTNLTAVSRDGQVRLRWNQPETIGGAPLSEYVVTASPGERVCSAPARVNSCTFSNLPPGRAYTFTVRARNSVGMSAPSSPTSTQLRRVIQRPPRDVQAQSGTGSIAVSWKPPVDRSRSGAVRYAVETSSGSSSCSTRLNRCVLTGLAPGRTYSVSVVAISSRGVSSKVSTSATVPAPRVEPPKPSLDLG